MDSENWSENLHPPFDAAPSDAEFEVEKFTRWFESYPWECDPVNGPYSGVGSADGAVRADEGDSGAVDSGVPRIEAAYLANVVAVIEENVEILGRIETAGICNSDRRSLLVRGEAVQRALFGFSHTWIADVISQHGLDDLPGSVPYSLSTLMRFSARRAGQRIRLSNQFGRRTALSGERLAPEQASTAAAVEDGVLDEEHQIIVKKFFAGLSPDIDVETRESADNQLAELARQLGPAEFGAAAERLFDTLDPDGTLVDEKQVANQCFFKFRDQGENGLSRGSFVIDAETRAYLEAAFAKWAKPGMCNPDDDQPGVEHPTDGESGIENPADGVSGVDRRADGESGVPNPNGGETDGTAGSPAGSGGSGTGTGGGTATSDPSLFDTERSGEGPDLDSSEGGDDSSGGQGSGDDSSGGQGSGDDSSGGQGSGDASAADARRRAERDHRSQGRRQHDALKTIVRQMLASGQLGTHRGLPVTAVVSMTLADLEAATGYAVTATGSLVRMRDAIRMASHAHHYLAIFDDATGRALHLGRSKRIASADQRIVLMASDRGCSFPGCTRPATWSQVHHIDEWRAGGSTDIDSLTFGCDMHHALVGTCETDWATTKAARDHQYPGRTLWHPPVTLDPNRTGLVNHYHHPNEYIYPAADRAGSVIDEASTSPTGEGVDSGRTLDVAGEGTTAAGGPEPGAP